VTITNLDFPSGLKAHIFVSWLHPFKEQKLVVVGEKKMAVFDDTLPWPDKLLLYPHKIRWEHNIPVPDKAEPERVDVVQAEPLRQECVHFLDCVANGCTPLTDGREGLAVLRVLNRAQSCLDSCGRWEARGGKREAQSAWREEEGGKWEAQSAKRQEEGSSQWTVDSEERAKRKALSRKREEESRKREESLALGAESGVFVHETAVIDPGVQIGANTKIWHFSHVLQNSRIGENCNIGKYVEIGPDVTIGNGCKIQNNVSVFKGITLEDFVFCGPGVVFTNIFNPRAAIRKMDQIRPTLVRSHATLGANCTIVCGVSIGEYAFIGAGAVVTRDVPDHALMVGNPARQTGYVCACGEKLTEDFLCVDCQSRYEVEEQGLRERGRD
jgi:UDP-2-acetamido-3-amino-2,3-dideoxy-glucuronate N-acetyltransferase